MRLYDDLCKLGGYVKNPVRIFSARNSKLEIAYTSKRVFQAWNIWVEVATVSLFYQFG